MTVYNATTNQAIFVNSREVAPIAATKDMFKGNPELSAWGK